MRNEGNSHTHHHQDTWNNTQKPEQEVGKKLKIQERNKTT